MSSILDALKKSERQRSLGRDLIFRNASPNAAPRLTGFSVAVLATLLILILAIGLLLFSLREPVPLPLAAAPAEAPVPSSEVGASGVDQRKTTTVPVPTLDSQAGVRAQAASLPEKSVSTSTPSVVEAPRVVAERQVTGTGETPWLSSLPQTFRSNLPPLVVNIHVYSPDRSRRILYINNRPVQQGTRIEGGVVVEEIMQDGVVLQFRGQRFKLPRPS